MANPSDDRCSSEPKQTQHALLRVREMKDKWPQFDHVKAMQFYRSLQKITFDIDCEGSRLSEVEELEKSLKHAADVHPKRPDLVINRINQDKIVSTSGTSNIGLGEHHDQTEGKMRRTGSSVAGQRDKARRQTVPAK
ncbi:hypothetical protein ACP4OV_001956 [Aristida adscensionis]